MERKRGASRTAKRNNLGPARLIIRQLQLCPFSCLEPMRECGVVSEQRDKKLEPVASGRNMGWTGWTKESLAAGGLRRAGLEIGI